MFPWSGWVYFCKKCYQRRYVFALWRQWVWSNWHPAEASWGGGANKGWRWVWVNFVGWFEWEIITIIEKYMAQSLHVGLCGFSTNLPFGICAIYFHLKVYQYRWAEIHEGKSRIVSWIRHGRNFLWKFVPFCAISYVPGFFSTIWYWSYHL